MKLKRYYIIEHKGHTINITRDMLTLGPMPVLWCNAGMYTLIPGAVLEEMFDSVLYIPKLTIWWRQTFELPQDIGRLLCDKSYNQANNSHK